MLHNTKFLFHLHLGEFTISSKVWFSYDLFMGSLTHTDNPFTYHAFTSRLKVYDILDYTGDGFCFVTLQNIARNVS